LKLKITLSFLLFTSFLYAQISKEKTWEATAVKTVNISAEGVFKINVKNSSSKTLSLKARIEGENAQHLVILDSISSETLFINSAYQPLFKNNNDKLSAHKVLSVEYDLSVPKHMILDIKSDIASVHVVGEYNYVFVESNQGECSLKQFLGNATINTIDGNITVQTNNAEVTAFSKTGVVQLNQFKYGKFNINCHSINGNIHVSKTKN